MRGFGWFFLFAATIPGVCRAATLDEQVESAAKEGKHAYVMFYHSNDSATKTMLETIQAQVKNSPEALACVPVRVNDPQAAELVNRFGANRMRLPAVFCLAPNGAVTGAFQHTVNAQQLEQAILTPRYADMVKALQEQKIAIVCLKPTKEGAVPAGIVQLEQDPSFSGRTKRITATADDPAESRFFSRMRVKPDIDAPTVLLFAPPGVYLGTFQADVSAATLSKTLHQSGKCNCEKCQHPH